MHTITTLQGRRFDAQLGESLLDAALRQRVALDHSCRTGRCGSCKGRLHSGETVALHQELGLTPQELAQGWILTCARQARGNVVLDIRDLGGVTLPQAKTLPCRIQSLQRLSSDVMHVVLRLPPTGGLEFLPGQYIDVIGAEGLRRSYSIANAPREDKQIELHIRDVPRGAMSHYWFRQAKTNDLLRLRGPMGTFFLRDQVGKDLVLLATGTGIAPIKAILEGIERLPEEQRPRSVTAYWGGRRRDDHYLTPSSFHRRWRFVPVLSRADGDWAGARGYVQDAMLRDQPDLPNTLVYACGSDTMIRSAQLGLLAAGLPDGQFRSDAFVCSAAN